MAHQPMTSQKAPNPFGNLSNFHIDELPAPGGRAKVSDRDHRIRLPGSHAVNVRPLAPPNNADSAIEPGTDKEKLARQPASSRTLVHCASGDAPGREVIQRLQ
jgi:hypothetical protein